jgi:dTDP-4-amino-4,6-dideoxygalactose transaminase
MGWSERLNSIESTNPTIGKNTPVRFLDLLRELKEIEAATNAALARVLSSGTYILGPEVTAFENEWAEFCGVKSAAGVGNGTDALALALIASGAVRPDRQDEVITNPLTAGYTSLAILRAGGIPVFADVDSRALTLDPQSIEQSITERTRAIVPVHLYGQMADMTAINQIAARHKLFVIEDAAQAHGATLNGKRAGAHGHAGAFSFYPTKNLGAYGDGGAVVSDDEALIDRVKRLREGGHQAALSGPLAGMNSRLDELQAAILRIKLKHLDLWTEKRRTLARAYDVAFAGTGFEVPRPREITSHVYHRYVVQCPARDDLRAFLAARSIETMIDYPFLNHQQPLLARGRAHPQLATAERAAGRILSLPLYAQLGADEQQLVIEGMIEWEQSKQA